MAPSGMIGVFDPAAIVLKQQSASFFRGRHDSPAARAAQDEVVMTIYEKDGRYVPVNHLYNIEDGDLEASRLATETLRHPERARKYMAVPLRAFNALWDRKDDAALGNKAEAMEKIRGVVDRLTAAPLDDALGMGVRVFDPAGYPRRTASTRDGVDGRTPPPAPRPYV